MPLFLVERTDVEGYDECDAIVVRAADNVEALAIATGGHEVSYREHVWWDPEYTGFKRDGSNLSVNPIDVDGPAGLILRSFCAG